MLNIQGNVASVDTINANTSYTRNSNLIANGSAVRRIQRGTLSKEFVIDRYTTYSASIALTTTDPNKCLFIYEDEYDTSNAYMEQKTVSLRNNNVTISFKAGAGGSGYQDGNIILTCNWQLIEFY